MKHIFLILLVFVFNNTFGQNNITFYQKTATDRLLDVYIDEVNNRYEVIGEIKTSLESGIFVYHVFNSFGELIQTINLNYIYNHGFSAHNWDGGARFIDGKRFTLSYQVKFPPPVKYYNCLVGEDLNVIWRNKPYLIEKISDSSYIGVYNCTNDSCILSMVNKFGNIIWELSYYSIFNTNISNCNIKTRGNNLIAIGLKRKADSFIVFDSKVRVNDSVVSSLDSISFLDDSFHVFNSLISLNGYLLEGVYNPNNEMYYRIKILNDSREILWDKSLYNDYRVIPQAYAVDNDENYHILLSHNLANNDTSGVFEFYKVSSRGKVLKHQFMYFVDTNLYFHKIIPLNDGGYFLLGGVMQSDNPLSTTGIIIKMDSNFYAEGGTYSSLPKAKYPYGKLAVFPNPLTTTATFTLPTLPGQKAEFRLYNITGRLVKQEAFTGNSFQLERGNLPTGMYLYHISVGEKVFVGKVLVK